MRVEEVEWIASVLRLETVVRGGNVDDGFNILVLLLLHINSTFSTERPHAFDRKRWRSGNAAVMQPAVVVETRHLVQLRGLNFFTAVDEIRTRDLRPQTRRRSIGHFRQRVAWVAAVLVEIADTEVAAFLADDQALDGCVGGSVVLSW